MKKIGTLLLVAILLLSSWVRRDINGETDDKLQEKYEEKFWEALKLLDPDVTDEEVRTTPVRITREKSKRVSGIEIECSTRSHSVYFSQENGRIVFFHNSLLHLKKGKEYEKSRLENPDKPYEYTPRLTSESFAEIKDFVPNIHILDIGKELEEYEKEVVYARNGECWLIRYRRVENGYRFAMGAVVFYIDDRTGRLSTYGYGISDMPVPKPKIKIKKGEIKGIIQSYLRGKSKKAQYLRENGFELEEDSLEISEATYTHTNYFFDESKELDYSMRNPIYLVYECRCVLKKSEQQAYTIDFSIDTATGKLVGGDYYPFDLRRDKK